MQIMSAGSSAQSPPTARTILSENASAAVISSVVHASSTAASPVASFPVNADTTRMIAAIGAVTGFDDWAPTLLKSADPDALRRELTTAVNDVLGLSRRRAHRRAVPARAKSNADT